LRRHGRDGPDPRIDEFKRPELDTNDDLPANRSEKVSIKGTSCSTSRRYTPAARKKFAFPFPRRLSGLSSQQIVISSFRLQPGTHHSRDKERRPDPIRKITLRLYAVGGEFVDHLTARIVRARHAPGEQAVLSPRLPRSSKYSTRDVNTSRLINELALISKSASALDTEEVLNKPAAGLSVDFPCPLVGAGSCRRSLHWGRSVLFAAQGDIDRSHPEMILAWPTALNTTWGCSTLGERSFAADDPQRVREWRSMAR